MPRRYFAPLAGLVIATDRQKGVVVEERWKCCASCAAGDSRQDEFLPPAADTTSAGPLSILDPKFRDFLAKTRCFRFKSTLMRLLAAEEIRPSHLREKLETQRGSHHESVGQR